MKNRPLPPVPERVLWIGMEASKDDLLMALWFIARDTFGEDEDRIQYVLTWVNEGRRKLGKRRLRRETLEKWIAKRDEQRARVTEIAKEKIS